MEALAEAEDLTVHGLVNAAVRRAYCPPGRPRARVACRIAVRLIGPRCARFWLYAGQHVGHEERRNCAFFHARDSDLPQKPVLNLARFNLDSTSDNAAASTTRNPRVCVRVAGGASGSAKGPGARNDGAWRARCDAPAHCEPPTAVKHGFPCNIKREGGQSLVWLKGREANPLHC